MDTIANDYFRTEFVGFDANEQRVHPDRPLIYASNHSGMAFPWDAIIFASQTLKAQNYELKKNTTGLGRKNAQLQETDRTLTFFPIFGNVVAASMPPPTTLKP